MREKTRKNEHYPKNIKMMKNFSKKLLTSIYLNDIIIEH